MGNRIENLGDYNKARIALQEVGGDLSVLYKEVGDTAVAKAAPKIFLKGGIAGAGILGLLYLGQKGIRFLIKRKQIIENEPALIMEFEEKLKEEDTKNTVVNDVVENNMPQTEDSKITIEGTNNK